MPQLSSAICFVLGLAITFFALAPWYVEQFLALLYQSPWAPTLFVVTGLAVFSNALLVAGLGQEPPWRGRAFVTGAIVVGVWLAGVYLAFGSMTELSWNRSAQAIALAISSLWVPTLAWSWFWPMLWSTRIAVVGTVMLTQAIFPMAYVVVDQTNDARYLVVRRVDSYDPSPSRAGSDSIQADQAEETLAKEETKTLSGTTFVPAMPTGEWSVETFDGAVAEKRTGESESQAEIIVNQLGQGKAWQIQLVCPGASVAVDKPFAFRFRAKSALPRSLDVAVAQNHAPWKNLGLYETVQLTPEWKDYEFILSPLADEPSARIEFQVGSSKVPFTIERLEWSASSTGASSPAMVSKDNGPPPQEPLPKQTDVPTGMGQHSERNFEQWSVVCEAGTSVQTQYRADTLTIHLGENQPAPLARLETRQLALTKGKSYVVRIRAQADRDLAIELAATDPQPPHGNLGLFQRVELKQDWQELEYRFTSQHSGPAWVHFNIMAPGGKIDISRVQLTPMESATP